MSVSSIQTNFSAGIVDKTLFVQGSELYKYSVKNLLNAIPDSKGFLFKRPGTIFAGLTMQGSEARLYTLQTPAGRLKIIFLDKKVYIFNEKFAITSILESPYEEEHIKDLNIAEFRNALYIVSAYYRPYKLYAKVTDGYHPGIQNPVYATYGTPITTAKPLSLNELKLYGNWFLEPVEFTSNVDFVSEGYRPRRQCFKGGRWFLSDSDAYPNDIFCSRPPDSDSNLRFNDFTFSESYLINTEQSLIKTTTYKTAGSFDIQDVKYDSKSANITTKYDPKEVIPSDKKEKKSIMYDTSDTLTTLVENRVKIVDTTYSSEFTIKETINDDHAIQLSETDLFGSHIMWMINAQRLVVGASRSVWMDNGQATTPSGFDLSRTLSRTSSDVIPATYGSGIFFCTCNKQSVVMISYNSDIAGYQTIDIAAHARSLFTSRVKEMRVMESIQDILWVLLEDGTLLTCTLSNGSFGWSRHIIGGGAKVKSIAIDHEGNNEDVLYLIVDRNHANELSAPLLYLEYLKLEDLTITQSFNLLDGQVTRKTNEKGELKLAEDSQEHEFMLGDKLAIQYGSWAKVDILYSETIKLSYFNKNIKLGFPYTSEMEFLPAYITSASGKSLNVKRAYTGCTLQVFRSAAFKIGYRSESEQLQSLNELQMLIQPLQTALEFQPLFTGIVENYTSSNTDEKVYPVLVSDMPLPITVQALQSNFSTLED